jgi:FAD/FMN-containing dehydrogenase
VIVGEADHRKRRDVGAAEAAAGLYIRIGIVGFVGDEGEEGVRRAYPPATLERLAQVKRQYDPDNLFRLNLNVLPDVT